MVREDWTTVYETHNRIDADLVRTTLEGAGFQVVERGDTGMFAGGPPTNFAGFIALAVPPEDARDARALLKELAKQQPPDATGEPISVGQAVEDVLALRQNRAVAGCKYCGIPTLDMREDELESRQAALLRAAGLGVNSASFSEFEPGERICTECAAHEVECDVCGRQMDGFLDGGVYRRANADEAYLCTSCTGELGDALGKTARLVGQPRVVPLGREYSPRTRVRSMTNARTICPHHK